MKALQTENKITTLSWNILYALFVLTQIGNPQEFSPANWPV